MAENLELSMYQDSNLPNGMDRREAIVFKYATQMFQNLDKLYDLSIGMKNAGLIDDYYYNSNFASPISDMDRTVKGMVKTYGLQDAATTEMGDMRAYMNYPVGSNRVSRSRWDKSNLHGFEAEIEGTLEYGRDVKRTTYGREDVSQEYTLNLPDDAIIADEQMEEIKDELETELYRKVRRNPQKYADGGFEEEVKGETEIEYEDGTVLVVDAYGELKEPEVIGLDEGYYDDEISYYPTDRSYYGAEQGRVRTMSGKPHTPRKLRKDRNIKPEEARMRKQMKAESTPFAEGRMAAKTMFTPERTSEDYHSGVDTEYMIAYGISPDELMEDVDSNRTRYLQFLAGWDDGWNYSSLVANKVIEDEDDFLYDDDSDLDLFTDYEFAGEYISMKHNDTILPQIFDEYIPEDGEVLKSLGILVGAGLLAVLGMKGYERMKMNAETFRATTPCSTDDDCPEGQVCVEGECLPICEDDGDCASWRECRDDLHPTERVCGEDKTDSIENPFLPKPKPVDTVDDTPNEGQETYSTATKVLIGVGVVGAVGFGIKMLGMMQD